jgi:DNA-directed RNA polymerase specialized sigma24 family protein
MNEKNTSPTKAISEHARNVESVYADDFVQLIYTARKYGHSTDRAKEIVNDAFVKMLEVEHPARIENLRAYIFKTVRNLALDRRRELKRRRDGEASLRRSTRTDDTHPSTEQEYAADLLARLIEKLANLSPKRPRAARLLRKSAGLWQRLKNRAGKNKR